MIPYSTETRNLIVCANCKREADKSTLKLCSGCNMVHYCNRECQLFDRKYHKAACKAVKTNNLNSTNVTSNHNSSLQNYCSSGDLEGLQRLISGGLDLNEASNLQVYDALHRLIAGYYCDCLKLLLEHNANPNVQNVDGHTPLLLSCEIGCDKCLSLLLQYKADLCMTNNKTGDSALYLACQNGHDKCVSLILQHDGDPNLLNNDGFSPLQRACGHGHDKCVSLLLKSNANPNTANDKERISPLQIACLSGHFKCVLLLLQYNADVNITNNMNGFSPLFIACGNGNIECASLLLQHNADPNIINNKDGDSSLHVACQNDYDKCISLLLQHNANPNIVNSKNGFTPLHAACQSGYDKCVSLLLSCGGNLENIDNEGFTPFLTACYCGHLKCAALLVEHGADIHFRSVPHKISALHYSCISRNVHLVAYILSLGLDVNEPDLDGITPLQYCNLIGNDQCIKLLIEHGADESTTKTEIPDKLITWMNKDLARTKEFRQNAKHCDYPDCCNKGNHSQSLHACSSCRAVYYCSREHQEAHWKEHKKLCKAIKK